MDLTALDNAELARLKADVLEELDRRAVEGNLQRVVEAAAEKDLARSSLDAAYKKAKAEAYKKPNTNEG